MADERIQELLPELRERWGAAAVPRPPQDVLKWLAREAAWEPNEQRPPTGSRSVPHGLITWLRSFGADRMCLAGPHDRARCELPVSHAGQHQRVYKLKPSVAWSRDEGPCDASHDSGRLRCVLPADHGGYHNYEPVKAEPTHPRHADLY